MRMVRYSEFLKSYKYERQYKKIDAEPKEGVEKLKHRQTCMICKKKRFQADMILTDYVAMNNWRCWRLWKCSECIKIV